MLLLLEYDEAEIDPLIDQILDWVDLDDFECMKEKLSPETNNIFLKQDFKTITQSIMSSFRVSLIHSLDEAAKQAKEDAKNQKRELEKSLEKARVENTRPEEVGVPLVTDLQVLDVSNHDEVTFSSHCT